MRVNRQHTSERLQQMADALHREIEAAEFRHMHDPRWTRELRVSAEKARSALRMLEIDLLRFRDTATEPEEAAAIRRQAERAAYWERVERAAVAIYACASESLVACVLEAEALIQEIDRRRADRRRSDEQP